MHAQQKSSIAGDRVRAGQHQIHPAARPGIHEGCLAHPLTSNVINDLAAGSADSLSSQVGRVLSCGGLGASCVDEPASLVCGDRRDGISVVRGNWLSGVLGWGGGEVSFLRRIYDRVEGKLIRSVVGVHYPRSRVIAVSAAVIANDAQHSFMRTRRDSMIPGRSPRERPIWPVAGDRPSPKCVNCGGAPPGTHVAEAGRDPSEGNSAMHML